MQRDEPDEQAWEKLCRQCGECCFEKLEDENGAIFYTSIPCRYLDVVTRHCRIYERRFEINPSCVKLTPALLPKLFWLPTACGYKILPDDLPKKFKSSRKNRSRIRHDDVR